MLVASEQILEMNRSGHGYYFQRPFSNYAIATQEAHDATELSRWLELQDRTVR